MEQTINPPDLDDLLAESRNALLANINCVQVGKLQKVNADQTVEIKIQFLRRLPDGTTKKYPLLVDCPYFVLQGGEEDGEAFIDMPIKKGNPCLVLFNDRNIDDWWDTGNVAVPADTRKHSISDGFALIGINTKAKALSHDGSAARFVGPKNDSGITAILSLKPDGTAIINAKKFLFGDGTNELISETIKGLKENKKLVGSSLLAGNVDAPGVSSTGTNSLITGGLAAMESALGTIITALETIKG